MWKKPRTEKHGYELAQGGNGKKLRIAIVACQYGLLMCSMVVAGGTPYVLSQGALTTEILVVESLTIATASISILYLALHNTLAFSMRKQRPDGNEGKTIFQKTAVHCLRFSVSAWLLASAMTITFTMATQPGCTSRVEAMSSLDFGSTCVVQRTTVAASLSALLLSGALFILIQRAREPFRCHLLGILPEQPLLPLVLPYTTSIDRANPMFSEMSFKCRSSTTLSSRTLALSHHESNASLLPKQPEKALGLGIYTSRTSVSSFLAPRPSLSSLRSHASTHLPPPSSPLPPLPAYFPEKYRAGSAMHKALHLPRRPQRPERRPSERTVRIVPPSPALSVANLQAFNKSVESLSSVYSRSISGERPSPLVQQRPTNTGIQSRTPSSSSTATMKRSPLGIVRLASDPDVIVGHHTEQRHVSHSSSSSSDSEIDDAATLQAKLPLVRGASDFGEASGWAGGGEVAMSYYQRSYQVCMGEMRKVDFTPLNVRRTRDSAAMFDRAMVGVAA